MPTKKDSRKYVSFHSFIMEKFQNRNFFIIDFSWDLMKKISFYFSMWLGLILWILEKI